MKRILLFLLLLIPAIAHSGHYYSAVESSGSCSYTSKDSQTSTASSFFLGTATPAHAAMSTTQTAGSSYDVDRVSFDLRKINSPTGNIYCYVYSTSDGNENPPNDREATSGTVIDASTLSTTVTTYNFDFASPFSETSGTDYQLVLYYDGTLSDTHYIQVKGDSYVGAAWGIYVNDSAPGASSDAANWSEYDANGSLTFETFDCE